MSSSARGIGRGCGVGRGSFRACGIGFRQSEGHGQEGRDEPAEEHADHGMAEVVRAFQHLVESEGPAHEQAGQRAADPAFPGAGREIEPEQGETAAGMAGRKTAAGRFAGPPAQRLVEFPVGAFAAVALHFVRIVHRGRALEKRNEAGDCRDAGQQIERAPSITRAEGGKPSRPEQRQDQGRDPGEQDDFGAVVEYIAGQWGMTVDQPAGFRVVKTVLDRQIKGA